MTRRASDSQFIDPAQGEHHTVPARVLAEGTRHLVGNVPPGQPGDAPALFMNRIRPHPSTLETVRHTSSLQPLSRQGERTIGSGRSRPQGTTSSERPPVRDRPMHDSCVRGGAAATLSLLLSMHLSGANHGQAAADCASAFVSATASGLRSWSVAPLASERTRSTPPRAQQSTVSKAHRIRRRLSPSGVSGAVHAYLASGALARTWSAAPALLRAVIAGLRCGRRPAPATRAGALVHLATGSTSGDRRARDWDVARARRRRPS
jgi:hypothetical protein